MALIEGTNSYVSLADAETYFGSVYDTAEWDALDDAVKEVLLQAATMQIDDRRWIGTAVSSSQPLGWPRNGATYFDEKLGLTVTLSNTDIPERVKIAVYEQANYILKNNDLLNEAAQTFESISIGSISLSDSNSKSRISKTNPVSRRTLRSLTIGGTSSSWWRAW